MTRSPLRTLTNLGQSVWLDELDRGRISSGALRRQIDEDGLRGVTSNPSTFEKALTGDGREYDAAIRALALRGNSVTQIYEALTVQDIQLAADVFRPSFTRLDGRDGFVSLEVSPKLAHDTTGTIAEAQRLWAAVNRPNVMIKIPATREGLPAIQELVAEGINVNVTLLFGLGRYEEVAEAYLAGLTRRVDEGQRVRIASVASFFLSRIDLLVDGELDERERAGRIRPEVRARLRGQVAIASARVAYQTFKRIFGSDRFRALAAKGARSQRLLWASTSTKNPEYSDVKYVEALIGNETVNTVPLETLNAYRDHGEPMPRIEEGVDEARAVLDELRSTSIDLDDVTRRLEDDGVRKFVAAYDRVLKVIAERRATALRESSAAEIPAGAP